MSYTLLIVLAGTTILGITSGILGVFTFLRKQSLLGDAISHASLPGIALMFLCTHSTNPLVLLSGGAFSGALGVALMLIVTRKTIIKTDSILGIILSVFFGFGLVLLTAIQKLPIEKQSILNKFIFGNASTLLASDVATMLLLSLLVLIPLTLFFKEFAIITFDTDFAHTCNYPIVFLNALLTFMTLITIMIGLQTVGVVLMSSMLIAPAAAARQWATSLKTMILYAAFFGASASIGGTLISNYCAHVPTGPAIVIISSIGVIGSLIWGKEA